MKTVWACKDWNENWSLASDNLAAALANENPLRPIDLPLALTVEVGESPEGLRWAQRDGWRIVAYPEKGYREMQHVPGPGWVLMGQHDRIPEDDALALCCALGIRHES